MRLLLEDHANQVIDEINDALAASPFLYFQHHTRILSGEEEGVFAWIAANYLREYFQLKSMNLTNLTFEMHARRCSLTYASMHFKRFDKMSSTMYM
jgi:Golgi nucleoside diphosphatase